jgi:hypothetical protein
MPMFSARLGAVPTARWLVAAVVGRHALVGNGYGICRVGRVRGLRVGPMAVKGRWGGVCVSWGFVATSVRTVLGRIVRSVGCVGTNRRDRNA